MILQKISASRIYIKHIVNIQKQPTYCNTPLFKFDGKTTALVYTLYSVSTICKDLLEHIENEIVKLSEVPEVEDLLEHIENEIIKLSEVDNDR